MTTPISGTSPRFDTSQFYTDPNACDPAAQSCPSTAPAAASSLAVPPRVITLEPVYVEGETGAQKLFDDYCAAEKLSATVACGKAAIASVGAASTAPVPVLFAGALVGAVFEGVSCGKELASVYNCELEAR